MIQEKNVVLRHEGKKPILYDLYYNSSSQPKPVVIFCHGYKGFKDWGAWHLVAKAFAEAGFFFLKFNFSHNGGTIEQPIDFPDLEAFAQNNYTKELDDIDRLLTSIEANERYASEANFNNISLIGHSRGGGIVLIKAQENKKIKKVVTWAGVSDFRIRFQEGTENFKQWEKDGIFYVENARTKQQMPHYFQFYKDFKSHEERFTIERAVRQLQIPQLIVHGSADPTVPVEEAQRLHSWNSNSKLEIINEGDHVFGASHPWRNLEMPQALTKVVQTTINFLC